MLETSLLRDLLVYTDKVKSENIVIAEWNMNRYQKISNFGLYLGRTSQYTYSANDTNIADGKNYILYDDDYAEENPKDERFSSLGSVFEPDRPDPGIVLLQFGNNVLLNKTPSKTMSTLSMSSGGERFYPFMEDRNYDYFNSGKNLTSSANTIGMSEIKDGFIESANPFVYYEEAFAANKIVIKVQNHVSVPKYFYVDVIRRSAPTTWVNVFSDINSTLFNDGVLELYYNSGSWGTDVRRVENIENIYNGSTDETDVIIGLRLRVIKMSVPVDNKGKSHRACLELIEMSPRIEADLSDYTESFSYNSSLGDSQFGLPVGQLVTSTGNITLSNENKAFISASALPKFEMLKPDVEFRFYQHITVSESGGDPQSASQYTIPLKTLYAESWDSGSDYSTNVSLSDRFRIFQQKKVSDMAFITRHGIRFSVLILMLLDNCGITGYTFKKTDNSAIADNGEDTRIKNFFCNNDQTLMEVLQDLAVATQSCMYIDAYNNLNVLTKERIVEIKDNSKSDRTNASTTGTDFWFVGDEDFTGTGLETGKGQYVSQTYVSNMSSIKESKISPVTNGDINYHSYGFRKIPGGENLLKDTIPKEYLDDVPAISAILGSGYSYVGTNLWSPGSDNNAVLGAANLISPIYAYRLKDIFTQPIVATSKEDAIRKMYLSATTASAAGCLVISLDRNEIYTIPDYEGYVFLDGEYIEFYGKVFLARDSKGSYKKVFFSNEDMQNYVANADLRSSLVPVGLIVKPEFNVYQNDGESNYYTYKVIGDGRGALNSRVRGHAPVINQADSDIKDSNKFSVGIGGDRSKNMSRKAQLKTSIKYDFSHVKGFEKLKKRLNVPAQSYQTYLGHLKIAGPKALKIDSSTFTASAIDASQQNINNDGVDAIIPGSGSLSFDEFVFFNGERYIHGQKIPLRFPPNIVSTRMRLFSGKKKLTNKEYTSSTLSSIAGLAFDVTDDGSGYYLEVESIGSGKDSVSPRAVNRNLRFYKLFYRKGKMNVEILFAGAVNVQAVVNRDIQITVDRNTPTDPVFELSVVINRKAGAAQYDIYYGDTKVNKSPIIDVRYNRHGKKVIDKNQKIEKNVVLFVRNDSQAIYEYVAAAGVSYKSKKSVLRKDTPSYSSFTNMINKGLTGMIGINGFNILDDDDTTKIYYFNDFAKIVRQAKKYDIRYTNGPARVARVIDISAVNPQYKIKSKKYTPFGAELVVLNTSPGAIALSEETSLPLYIYGICLEELTNGSIAMDTLFDKNIDYKKKTTEIAFNRAVNGEKTFSLDSKYIQSPTHAKDLLRWIESNCGRERLSLEMEIFPNPLLELGDKVKIVAKDRGYYQTNERFNNKTFIVSDINHSVSENGPTMTVAITEIGEK